MNIPEGYTTPKIACRIIGYKLRQFMNLLYKGVIQGMRVDVPGSQPLWLVHLDELARFASSNLQRLEKIVEKHKVMYSKHKTFLTQRGVYV